MKIRYSVAAMALFALGIFISQANSQPNPQLSQGLSYNSFTPAAGSNVVTLTLGAASSNNIALGSVGAPNTPSIAWVQNTGSNPANVILGHDNTITGSLTAGTYIGAGACVSLNAIGASWVAGYSTAGTTLVVGTGTGVPAGSCGGSGGGGGGGGSGVSTVDEAVFTAGTSVFAGTGGFYQTTATSNPLTNGQQGMLQMTAYRAAMVNSRDTTGAENIGTVADAAWTSGNGTLIALGKATIAALNQGVGTSGAAVPNNILYTGGNRGGNLYGQTYVNPSGSIEAGQVDLASVAGATVATGHGTAAGAIRVELPTDGTGVVTPLSTTNAGGALVKGGVGVVNGGSTYQTVAASQTAQVLQTSTGAAGDYLSHCVIQPTTTAAGTVIVYDNATTVFTFTTGTLSNLAPIAVPFGAVSTSGAWKVTTGANETATCYGKFSALPSSLLRAFG